MIKINMCKKKSIIVLVALVLVVASLCSCGTGGSAEGNFPNWDEMVASDFSGYPRLEGYDKELVYMDMTNTEVLEAMKAGKTFVVYYGFAGCPWCNHVVGPLNDIALEKGLKLAYVDTRWDPEWSSNLDIDNYDKFADIFSDYLALDENGIPHLYVPKVFFIKDGKVVACHDGTAPGHEDAASDMTEEQLETMKAGMLEGFTAIGY